MELVLKQLHVAQINFNMEINASNSNATNNAIVSSTSMFEDTKAKAMKYLDNFIGICQFYCGTSVQ